jgi:peptidoglycan/LPS O-acetylase OafA/YrhL
MSTNALTPPQQRDRIHYIDGLRGLAAFAVVLSHALEMQGYHASFYGVQPIVQLEGTWISTLFVPAFAVIGWLATIAVKLFIVISGYSLMLAVARSKDGALRGGLGGYFKRRIRRIWPPYYATLVLSLALLIIPGMYSERGVYQDLAIPVTTEAITAHALFIQNLNPAWTGLINPPLWTIAVEEQIYVLFPFLLLPLWRRFGSLTLVAVGFGLAYLLMALLPPEYYNNGRLWYVGLFACGAVGASISFSQRAGEQRWRGRLGRWWVVMALFGLWALVMVLPKRIIPGFEALVPHTEPFTDVMFGFAVMSLLICLTENWKRGFRARSLLGFLESRPIVGVGIFSYSMYLMHAPILAVITLALHNLGIIGDVFYVWILVLGVPLTMFGTYLFHQVFERPFMPQAAKSFT